MPVRLMGLQNIALGIQKYISALVRSKRVCDWLPGDCCSRGSEDRPRLGRHFPVQAQYTSRNGSRATVMPVRLMDLQSFGGVSA
jgi:hypothetical protein